MYVHIFQLKVRINAMNLNCSVIRVDDQICAIPYLHKSGGSKTPVIHVKSEYSELFKIYEKEFDTVWDNSSPFAFNNCEKYN
jgi:hypothetical protein